ncbi:hypothetical protein CR513_19932, partial [Mucuna pruriens]
MLVNIRRLSYNQIVMETFEHAFRSTWTIEVVEAIQGDEIHRLENDYFLVQFAELMDVRKYGGLGHTIKVDANNLRKIKGVNGGKVHKRMSKIHKGMYQGGSRQDIGTLIRIEQLSLQS